MRLLKHASIFQRHREYAIALIVGEWLEENGYLPCKGREAESRRSLKHERCVGDRSTILILQTPTRYGPISCDHCSLHRGVRNGLLGAGRLTRDLPEGARNSVRTMSVDQAQVRPTLPERG